MMNPIKVLLVGAGSRGNFPFGKFALENPSRLKFVAVVDPKPRNREYFAKKHKIPKENQFKYIRDFIDSDVKVHAAINASADKKHLYTTLPLLRHRIPVLLEKPIAVMPDACIKLYRESVKHNTPLFIAHELRYTKIFSEIEKLIKGGKIGKLLSIEHEEAVGYWHCG